MIKIVQYWLVVLTLLKNMKVNGKDEIPYNVYKTHDHVIHQISGVRKLGISSHWTNQIPGNASTTEDMPSGKNCSWKIGSRTRRPCLGAYIFIHYPYQKIDPVDGWWIWGYPGSWPSFVGRVTNRVAFTKSATLKFSPPWPKMSESDGVFNHMVSNATLKPHHKLKL